VPPAAWTDFAPLPDRALTLVVIDGVTEAMTTEGLALGDNTDVAAWIRLLPKRFAAAGAVVVVIDHVGKNRDDQGR
jgi:hypothetical protein